MGQLFAGGFRVKLRQNVLRVQLRQNFLHQQKGVVRGEIHIAPANEIDEGHRALVGFKNAPAPARGLGSQVGGPQDPGASSR